MESKYTIEERNDIYKRALIEISGSRQRFACVAVGNAINRVKPDSILTDVTEFNFPELFSFKPSGLEYTSAWLSDPFKTEQEDRQTRIEVLTKCIEMTNGK